MLSIVDEIRNNREKGAKMLENEYKAGLMAIARRFCANETDAEELVNRTFSIVIDKIDSYLEQSAFFGWMSRILINCHLKDSRRKSNEMEFCVAEMPEDAQDDEACAKVFREVDATILRDAIDRLPPDMKQTLLLHYFMDMPVKEVARFLSIPSGTVMWRLHYARKMLAAKLGAGGRKALALMAAAAFFMAASAAVAVGIVRFAVGGAGSDVAVAPQEAGEAAMPNADLPTQSVLGVSYVPDVAGVSNVSDAIPSLSANPTKENAAMNIRKTTVAALAMTTLAAPFSALSSVIGGGDVAVELNSAAYKKVMEDAGPLAGNWSLPGIVAWNGAEQVAYSVVSNRPYDSGTLAAGSAECGEMPLGPYVCRLSVFNHWSGERTYSYRMMVAQPVGSYDIYARVTAVTISAAGVNLVNHPDIRKLVGTEAIEFAYTKDDPDDLARFPVSRLRFKQQNGYIESDGNLGFCTGYYVGPNTKLELDFALTSIAAEEEGKCLMAIESPNDTGSSYATTLPRFLFYVGKVDEKLRLTFKGSKANGDVQGYNFYDADLDRHTVVIDLPATADHFKLVTEGEQAYASGSLFGEFLQKTATIPLALFGQTICGKIGFPNRPDTGYEYDRKSKMKVFGFRIYEKVNGEYRLKRNFVPCLKGGLPGFNEECTGTFFTGENISTVGHGGDIAEISDDPYISTGDYNNCKTAAATAKCLFLETGYVVKPTSRIELDFAPLTPYWSTSDRYSYDPEFMFAKNSGSSYLEFGAGGGPGSGGKIYCRLGTDTTYYKFTPLADAYNQRMTFVVDATTMSMVKSGITNFTFTVASGKGIVSDLAQTPLKLGTSYGTGNFAPMKIYGLKIYESGVLVKDFRPIVTNGVAGLFDTAGASAAPLFASTYASDQPRLAFTPGGAIACLDGSEEAYLDFYDNVKIDTGCVITKDSCIEAEFAIRDPNDGRAQYFLVQEPPSTSSSVVGVYLYLRTDTSPQTFGYKFEDCVNYSGTPTVIPAAHDRTYFKFDGPSQWMAIVRGGNVLASRQTSGTLTASGGSTTLTLGGSKCTMRLYRLKVSQGGALASDFVPAKVNGVVGLYDRVKDEFRAPKGGTLAMSGKGAGGVGEFIETPQPARLMHSDAPVTLSCRAIGAKSYEWFRDGVKLDGETGETLSVEWIPGKPYVHTYSAVPVYEVFNETVRGEPAETTVVSNPRGVAIVIR